MKINWKIRLKSKKFWVALAAFVGLIVTDLGIDAGAYEAYVQAVLLLLIAGGVVTDPTTSGVNDSKQALKYDKPKKDSDYIG